MAHPPRVADSGRWAWGNSVQDFCQYGILLPHFGTQARRERLVESAQQVERYGFDAVWVRDHLVFHPHGHEDQDRTHVDPFVVLSAIAAVTRRLILATGSLIPHRHPIHSALLLGSLDFIAGSKRIIAGMGLGTYDHEFVASGMEGWDRREVVREQVEIFHKLWRGGPVSHEGRYYRFQDVEIRPTPTGGTLPVWYCGTSAASVRRAVEYCDGWIPGRTPRREYRRLMQRMRRLALEAGKPLPMAGVIPYVVPARTYEEAVRAINLGETLKEADRLYPPPPSGRYETLDDLDGAVIAGPPERIAEEVRRFQAEGAVHVVFDMRLRFDAWEECLGMIGEEVLPELRRGDPAVRAVGGR